MACHSSRLRVGSSISSSRPGKAQQAPRPSICSSRLKLVLIAFASKANGGQANQPKAGAGLLFQTRSHEALHELQRRLRPLIQVAAHQQRPAHRLAKQLRAVRQTGSAQQILEQDVGRIAALERLAGGQFHQQGAIAGTQQLQGKRGGGALTRAGFSSTGSTSATGSHSRLARLGAPGRGISILRPLDRRCTHGRRRDGNRLGHWLERFPPAAARAAPGATPPRRAVRYAAARWSPAWRRGRRDGAVRESQALHERMFNRGGLSREMAGAGSAATRLRANKAPKNKNPATCAAGAFGFTWAY